MASAKRIFNNLGAGLKKFFTPESVVFDRKREDQTRTKHLPVGSIENPTQNESSVSLQSGKIRENTSLLNQKTDKKGSNIEQDVENQSNVMNMDMYSINSPDTLSRMTHIIPHFDDEFSLKLSPKHTDIEAHISDTNQITNWSVNDENILENAPHNSAHFNHAALSNVRRNGHVTNQRNRSENYRGTEREFNDNSSVNESELSKA